METRESKVRSDGDQRESSGCTFGGLTPRSGLAFASHIS